VNTNINIWSYFAQFYRRIRDVSDESCGGNQLTYFVCNIFLIVLLATMWKNIVVTDRPQMAIWRMCIACWRLKATNTHWEYVILIAFPTATAVVRACLSVTLYVHWLSCINFCWQVKKVVTETKDLPASRHIFRKTVMTVSSLLFQLMHFTTL